ncbi:class I SAM-dependent rRNA methyltransferase [Holdemania massiliensis]|uniref:Methyltransferase domain-containing protein n=1 Tax=Holdemania massiliensis TaxID=1468449 RepID=A0A6N7SA37_9FIRM|nr:class I SAM-dependent rRNA methyltransferase [Holdemania massiliensis]MSA72488.1 methyltransferase domain-containing protein [Holdemania massiliensis]MSA90764.1 methyltransferase domain-containing protein [Holdemania massiliensis]MSB79583.1 methyltransferase domain-containing protein [Holdemania massiliensis]MSC34494.1 methyltransferase domain-containing protein [Holdemania massiliensis]MSC40884.1 methyltransferase domain-containing protein [Holdemania massiliensis]
MKQPRQFSKVTVTKKAQRSLQGGHPWVYAGEVITAEPTSNGALCDLINEKGTYLGTGFYNDQSLIRVRVLSQNANDQFDEAFWRRRIRYSLDYRRIVMGADFSCCRLIFGEADHFPGWTVDRFGAILVSQIMSLGIEQIKDQLFALLWEEMEKLGEPIEGIYERNDIALRRKEGMGEGAGWAAGFEHPNSTLTQITENGIRYEVDFGEGQKTGFFLDQKYNRGAAARLAQGRTVLDCCTHTGSFALNAAQGGAKRVIAADISASALASAKRNAQLNGLEAKMEFVQADVFDLLADEKWKTQGIDYIILDPPAFTKSRKTIHNAYQGYCQINTLAMKLLPRGALLATASCSHFMEDAMFEDMLQEAAQKAKVELRQIEVRHQAPDHPILMSVPETRYLKFYLFQIV